MKSLLTFSFVVFFFTIGFSQEQCLQKALTAYDNEKWNDAIKQAENCTIQFGPQARKIQKDLKVQGYSFPCEYTVPNNCTSQQKNEIFGHGLLNDVSVSYWIIGMSNLRLGNRDLAKRAFEKAKELTFGLCFNPKTFNFWSPSVEAELQLGEMN